MAMSPSNSYPAEPERIDPDRRCMAGPTPTGLLVHRERRQHVVPFLEQKMAPAAVGLSSHVRHWEGWRPGWHQVHPHLVLFPLCLHEAYILPPVGRPPAVPYEGARAFQVQAQLREKWKR